MQPFGFLDVVAAVLLAVPLRDRSEQAHVFLAHLRQGLAGVEDVGLRRVAVADGPERVGQGLLAAVQETDVRRHVPHHRLPAIVVAGAEPAVPTAGSFG